MGRVITKELALKIAKKLGARTEVATGAHVIMGVYVNDVLVASFGIRRGSEKDKGHDHVQRELHVSTRFAKEMGQCTKSRAQWVAAMIERGLVDPPAA